MHGTDQAALLPAPPQRSPARSRCRLGRTVVVSSGASEPALARAFARGPRLVLLDEALSAMDRELRRELGEEVRRYVDDAKIPAIVVTHHRMEAHALGDRMIMMRAGRVEAVGSVAELLKDGPRD